MSTNGTDGSRRRRRDRPRFGLGSFDEQIADLTPPGHDRVETDAPPEEPSGVDPGEAPSAPDPAPGATTETEGEVRDGEDLAASADPLIGRTGARFNSRARRSRRDRARPEQDPAEPDAAEPSDPESRGPRHEGGGGGAEDPAGDRAATHRREEPPTVPFVPEPAPGRAVAPSGPPSVPTPVAAEAVGRRTDVRPYIRTNGRTRPRTELALETMVSLPSPRPAMDDPEHRAIGDLCDDPRSVAEVAALLSLPLGVARVLIDDMAVEGLLRVHATGGGPNEGPDLSVLERVLSGLHRL